MASAPDPGQAAAVPVEGGASQQRAAPLAPVASTPAPTPPAPPLTSARRGRRAPSARPGATGFSAPLGGVADWALVAAACVAQLVTFGAVYAFGVVLEPFEVDVGGATSGAALVPVTAAFTLFLAGPLTGRWSDRRGAHWMVAAAAVLLPSGLLLTSAAGDLWLAVVGFGVLGGLAAGCVYVPVVAHVVSMPSARATWYAGIVVAGVTLGPALSSPLLRALVDAHGWRVAYRIYAVLAVAVLAAVAAVVARARVHPVRPPAPPTMAWRSTFGRLLRDGMFLRLYTAVLAVAPSLYVGLVFLPSYASDRDLPGGAGATLVTTLGMASAGGRVVLAALARRVPPLAVFRSCFVLLALSSVLWLVADGRFGLLLVSALVAGTGYGGVAGIAPAVVARGFGTAELGATLGVLYTALGVGGLVTGPIVGAIVDGAGYPPALGALAGLAVVGALLVPAPNASAPEPTAPNASAPEPTASGVPAPDAPVSSASAPNAPAPTATGAEVTGRPLDG